MLLFVASSGSNLASQDLVRTKRVELLRVSPYGPEPYAYASSATSALIFKLFSIPQNNATVN